MAVERIPDAALGSAPGLEIRGRAGRMPASEGGQSLHSIGSSVLSEKGWEGLPIAVKTGVDKNGKNEYTYFDRNENELTREQAYIIADGVVFYQTDDPSKWSIRQRGRLFAHDKVKTIIEQSRACSDVANLQDVGDQNRDLSTIKEEVKEVFPRTSLEQDGNTKTTGLKLYLVAAIWLLALAAAAASWPAARHEMTLSNSGQQGRYHLENVRLDPEIASLLKAHEMGGDDISRALLDSPPVAEDNHSSRKMQEQQAAAEIDRILSSRKESDILGPEPLSRQQHEFRRIALLLHPDRGLVSAGDERASIALRLAFAARRRVLARR